MLFQVNGLEISNLNKSGGIVTVDIIANHLTEDTDGETVLKDAFSPETVKEFLDIGVLEYWHESKNPHLSKEDKNKYLLGRPTAFRWENGKPIVTAALTKSHPIVQDMLPHLEAKQPVYAASIGGSKVVLEAVDSTGKEHRVIPQIKWDHLAIAPMNAVINREKGMNVRLLQKANDILCEFNDFDDFKRNRNVIENEDELRKALLAPGSVADLSSTPGGVLTEQSLEKSPVNLTLSEQEGLDFIDAIIGIKEKRIPVKKDDYLDYFEEQNKKDFGQKSYGLIDKFFQLKKGAEVT
ncbi:hypothetical protein KAR91_51570 [Candidatus Pacearchaeota archaeon]|nr:hypothetical protein [Candidatus Pacearchaeota archaeon]